MDDPYDAPAAQADVRAVKEWAKLKDTKEFFLAIARVQKRWGEDLEQVLTEREYDEAIAQASGLPIGPFYGGAALWRYLGLTRRFKILHLG